MINGVQNFSGLLILMMAIVFPVTGYAIQWLKQKREKYWHRPVMQGLMLSLFQLIFPLKRLSRISYGCPFRGKNRYMEWVKTKPVRYGYAVFLIRYIDLILSITVF